jgi:hypothetical protein
METKLNYINESGEKEMNGSRIVASMKEAVAISKGNLPKDLYTVHIPAKENDNPGVSAAFFENIAEQPARHYKEQLASSK